MWVEGTEMQLNRQMLEPQCNISSPIMTSQVVSKMQNLAHVVEIPPRRGRSCLSNDPLK